MMPQVHDLIRDVFGAAGGQGWVHAREVGTADGPEVAVDADSGVVLASVFKIPVALAYARAVADGRLDPLEPARVVRRHRTGGIGTGGAADDVVMSLRDLARFMLTMSDNAATDLLYERLGQRAVQAVLDSLGLSSTRILGDCETLFATMAEDLSADRTQDVDDAIAAARPEQVWQLRVLDPARTNASTPRDITRLLDAIWTDRAATPDACASVRAIMAEQIWPHRLSSGFAPDVAVAAKTGTLPAIRNEAGVVTYPDGRRYAVAVFTRSDRLDGRQPLMDASIGRAGRIAVDWIRAEAG
jgi:beta-lactamase class A